MTTNRQLISAIILTCLAAGTALAGGGTSSQDPQITVNPVVRQFPVTIIGDNSAPADFTVTNLSAGPLSINTIDITGVNADNFDIMAHDCPATLGAGSSCTISTSFTPLGKGTKSALLLIQTSSNLTPNLSAYLTNSAGAAAEAQQRMPPVLTSVTIPDTMDSGVSYDLTWDLEGYDSGYKSYAVIFDCTGIIDGSCGNSYGDASKIAESSELTPTATTSGDWSYSGVTAKKFTYVWHFTPTTRSGGAAYATDPGTDVVIRFYQKSDIDTLRNNNGVSLLIPGNGGLNYYDNAGRRIVKKIRTP